MIIIRSEYFNTMLLSGLKETHAEHPIDISDTFSVAAVFEAVMEYLVSSCVAVY